MAEQTRFKREREPNWTSAEKAYFREAVQKYLRVVEDKGNDTKMIQKKKVVWNYIRNKMLAAGFDREVNRMKQQWTRMKLGTKKRGVSEVKFEAARPDCATIPKLKESDMKVKIAKDSFSHAEEMHLLQMEQLRGEIAHQSRMNQRREEHLEELHMLQCQLLRQQFQQQEVIFENKIKNNTF